MPALFAMPADGRKNQARILGKPAEGPGLFLQASGSSDDVQGTF
jgi:hypothetical protein